jgi:hypothetical protein
MAEEPTAPEVQDTPTPAPETDTPTPVVDYEARYNSLRPEFDRRSQQLREYEERLAAFEQAQQPEDDEEDYEYEYEDPVARRELAELKALIASQQEETQQRQQAEQENHYVNSEIETLEKELEEEFSDDEWNTLGILSERFRDEDGKPDVRVAYKTLFEGVLEPRKQKWVKTKRSPKVSSGPAAAQSIDLDDPQTRREYMARQLQELEGQD